jgi:lysophospholipase L1-like esterase
VRRSVSIFVGVLALLFSASVAGAPVAAAHDGGDRDSGHGHRDGRSTGYYVALGDSLAAGYQPGLGDDKTGGYVGGVEAALLERSPRTRLKNLSCSGETVLTLVEGGRCSYSKGTQLAEALYFLHRHGRQTRQITIDIGANDVQRCVQSGTIDATCIQEGMTTVATYLPQVLQQLHHAAPRAQLLVLNYYNPFLAAYLLGPAGQALATQSSQLQLVLNGIIDDAAAGSHATLVDIATAFRSGDETPVSVPGIGTIPTNVATICSLTWMCVRSDIHANDAGYAVMAAAVVAVLEWPSRHGKSHAGH